MLAIYNYVSIILRVVVEVVVILCCSSNSINNSSNWRQNLIYFIFLKF